MSLQDSKKSLGAESISQKPEAPIKPDASKPPQKAVHGAKMVSDDVMDGQQTQHTTVQVDKALSGEEQLALAMQMYGLTDTKVVHDPLSDTKAVLSWSQTTMVIAFRGTQSLANCFTDAKAWRMAHPPKRGIYVLATQPLVHKGFLRAWQKVEQAVMDVVNAVLESATLSKDLFRVYVTGHSLGGALALLASWAIQDRHRLNNLTCYTFGAPRPGNRAFAQSYERLVPDTWNVINDRDAVPRTGKLFVMYKRPGDRVLINSVGDIRVRPTVFEVNLHTRGYSVSQHYLASYLDALGSIIVAQVFKSKAMEGGLEGVKRLAKMPDICKLLLSNGVDLPLLVKQPPMDMKQTLKKGKWTWRSNLAALVRELQQMPMVFDSD